MPPPEEAVFCVMRLSSMISELGVNMPPPSRVARLLSNVLSLTVNESPLMAPPRPMSPSAPFCENKLSLTVKLPRTLSSTHTGEIMGLEWDRVDFSRGVLQLEITKNGRRREIPMNQAVYDALSALPRTGARLFRGTVRKAFEGAVERAGLKDFHFHDLRHDFASHLTIKGRPLKEVQELLGHRSITQTERYAHLAPGFLREAVTTLEINTSSTQRPVGDAQVAVAIAGS